MVYEQSDSLKPVGRQVEARDPKRPDHVTPHARARARAGRSPTPSSSRRSSAATRSATSATPRRSTSAPNQLVAGPRRPLRAGPPAAARRRQGHRCASRWRPSRPRRWRARPGSSGSPALRAAPATRAARRDRDRLPRPPRDVPRPLLDAVLKVPADKLPAFVGVDLGEQGYALAKVLKSGVATRRAGNAEQLRASSTRSCSAEAETQAYYAALRPLQRRDHGPRSTTPGDAPRVSRRGCAGAIAASGPLAIIRRSGGGCSSVGRVQDCDSCCRGFESHQPPQSLIRGRASTAPAATARSRRRRVHNAPARRPRPAISISAPIDHIGQRRPLRYCVAAQVVATKPTMTSSRSTGIWAA